MLSIPGFFGRMLDDFPSEMVAGHSVDVSRPRTDVIEDDKEIRVTVDAPGFKKEQISIDLQENNLLTISAERQLEQQQDGEKYHMRERQTTQFQRSFRLPRDICRETVSASFEDGVLRVVIPKAARREPQSQRIGIQ